MFPIPFNFPFRKANGDISTIGAEINAGGGGGSSYTLPTASANVKGGIKIGAGLSMDGEVLNNTNPTPATPYTLPPASAETLGGVKVGSNLSIDENGVLSASGGGGSSTFTKVWTNPNPNNPKGGSDIEISNVTNYTEFIIRYKKVAGSNEYITLVTSFKEINDEALLHWIDTSNKYIYQRAIYLKGTNALRCSTCTKNNFSADSDIDNSYLVPIEIYAR